MDRYFFMTEVLKKLKEHDQQFVKINKRFDAHDKQIDRLTIKLLEHDERFDQMVTKTEFNSFKNEMLQGQDAMMGVLQKLDQEVVVIHHLLKETIQQTKTNTQDIDKNTKDIEVLKLKIA